MIKMQLNITLRYSIINELIIKERIYLGARKRHNIVQKDNETTERQRRRVKSDRFFVFLFFRFRNSFLIKFLIVTLLSHIVFSKNF